jgi:hypothetical protein
MVYPAHIQWNGFISGHVGGLDGAMVPSRPSHPVLDGRSAVPLGPMPPAACAQRRRLAAPAATRTARSARLARA